MNKLISCFFVCGFFLNACASSQPTVIGNAQPAKITSPSETKVSEAASSGKKSSVVELLMSVDPRRVNKNWSAFCNEDEITTIKTCRLSTFDKKNKPFQIYFINDSGPFLMVGYHTYPGMHPVIRVDKNKPITIGDDGGVTPKTPESHAVEEILRGSVLKARYYSWPSGIGEDMEVDLTGVDEGWSKLQEHMNTQSNY